MTQLEITEAALGRVDPDETREARLKRMKIRSWRRGIKDDCHGCHDKSMTPIHPPSYPPIHTIYTHA